jgi:hypothetical protein
MPKAVPIFKIFIPLTEYFLKILFICIFKKVLSPMYRIYTKIFLLFFSSPLLAQFPPAADYPKHYFRDPLDIPISLAGNFGELRPGHYHMGIDIRTQRKEHLSVHAAADGYISQVKIEPGGFGQAIYINHPNGYTTVYAHLKEFIPALSTYVKQEEYRQETWALTLQIPANLFPVKQGDLIAYSGNTGGSEAPHLHFEIRRTADDTNLNPLLFGLPVIDKVPPSILRLAIYDRTKSIYEQVARLIPIHKISTGHLLIPGLISLSSPKVSFGISAIDRLSGSSNPIGIFEAELFDQGRENIRFQMNNISYADTRNINGHIDYKTRANGGPYIQLLACLPGYANSIYDSIKGNGVIDLSNGSVHRLRIVVKDAYGNSSRLDFKVAFGGSLAWRLEPPGKLCYPGIADQLETKDCRLAIGKDCLYDSAHINIGFAFGDSSTGISRVYTIGSPAIPLQDFIQVAIKPTKQLDSSTMDHVVLQRSSGGNMEVRKVTWQNGWADAKFRDFGNFQLLIDLEPPLILSVGNIEGTDLHQATKLEFVVKDNLGSIKEFRAVLDGKWLLFTNDKSKSFIYIFDEHCPVGPHFLKLTAKDEAGNLAERDFRFIR